MTDELEFEALLEAVLAEAGEAEEEDLGHFEDNGDDDE